jgi:hypothetical protein
VDKGFNSKDASRSIDSGPKWDVLERFCDEYGEKGVDESRLVVALQATRPSFY